MHEPDFDLIIDLVCSVYYNQWQKTNKIFINLFYKQKADIKNISFSTHYFMTQKPLFMPSPINCKFFSVVDAGKWS